MNNKIVKIIFTVLALALPLYIVRFHIFSIPTTLFEILLYIGFIVWLVLRYKNKQPINWQMPAAVWLWVLVGVIAAFVDPSIISGLGQWKALFFDGILIALLVKNEKDLASNVLPKALIVSGALVALTGIAGILGWQVAADGRWLGIFGLEASASPNYLSMFLAPLVALALVASFLWEKPWRSKAIAALLLMLIALIGTQSRGALVGIVGAAAAAFLWLKLGGQSKKLLTYLIAFFIIAAAATFALARPDFNAGPTDGRVATSNNIRYYIWQTSFAIAAQKPVLGVGLSNYQNYFTQFTKDRVNYPEFISPLALTAHDLYLHVLVTMGIVGLVVFVWLLVIIIKKILTTATPKEMALPIAGFATILFYGLVDTPFFKNDLAGLWWIFIALILFCYDNKK